MKLILALAAIAAFTVSAFAGSSLKISVDTQNETLKRDIERYMSAAIAQFPWLNENDSTLIIEPRSSGNTFFFDMILVSRDGKYLGNVTGVCSGDAPAMRLTFKQAVVSMVRSGAFESTGQAQ
jgi:hypothetical protein